MIERTHRDDGNGADGAGPRGQDIARRIGLEKASSRRWRADRPTHWPFSSCCSSRAAPACPRITRGRRPSPYPGYQQTELGQLFEAQAKRHPGESGFAIIRTGRNAFTDPRGARRARPEDTRPAVLHLGAGRHRTAAGRACATGRRPRGAGAGAARRHQLQRARCHPRGPGCPPQHRDPHLQPLRHPRCTGARVPHQLRPPQSPHAQQADRETTPWRSSAGAMSAIIYFQVATEANYRDLDIAAAARSSARSRPSSTISSMATGRCRSAPWWSAPMTRATCRPHRRPCGSDRGGPLSLSDGPRRCRAQVGAHRSRSTSSSGRTARSSGTTRPRSLARRVSRRHA